MLRKTWKNVKYQARVGYGKIGRHGLWYEDWNDMTWRPTLETKIVLFLRKTIFKKPTFKTLGRFIWVVSRVPIIKKCIEYED